MELGFDVVSDLYLEPNDSFNWEGKATSLYCIVAGNISSDNRTILQTLMHLSRFYQGIFYIPGTLEFQDVTDFDGRIRELIGLCSSIQKIAFLYYNVVIIDGVAILGANGWNHLSENDTKRYDDIAYLHKSIDRLQRHLDVKKIVIATNAVPKKELYFGEEPAGYDETINLDYCLKSDTEGKISHWVFGTYEKSVDTTIDDVNFVNNSYYKNRPYWAKRITVTV